MTESEKPRNAPGFCLVGVYRKCFVITSAGMRDVICASPYRTLRRNVDDVEYEWGVHRNCGMQTSRRLPRPIADAANEISLCSGRLQRQAASIAHHREL